MDVFGGGYSACHGKLVSRISEERVPGSENRQCKGPEADTCLVHSSREARVTGVQGARGRVAGDAAKVGGWQRACGPCKDFDIASERSGSHGGVEQTDMASHSLLTRSPWLLSWEGNQGRS